MREETTTPIPEGLISPTLQEGINSLQHRLLELLFTEESKTELQQADVNSMRRYIDGLCGRIPQQEEEQLKHLLFHLELALIQAKLPEKRGKIIERQYDRIATASTADDGRIISQACLALLLIGVLSESAHNKLFALL